MKCRLLHILLLTFATLMASVSSLSAKEQYVDPVFGDTINRNADDFVMVSLLVADPGTAIYSVMGHACLRMQCPVFDMDYCYSYESEDVQNRLYDFFAGNLKMGLFVVPVDEYCQEYREEGRGVCEYKLNLPIAVKRNLWRVIDQHIAEGKLLRYDYLRRGCTTTCVQFLREALGNMPIQYDASLYQQAPSARELVKRATVNALWTRFVVCFIAGSEVDKPLHGEKQLIIPTDLVAAWQKTTVNGQKLLSEEATVLVEGKPQTNDTHFTPLVAMLLLLIVTIANLFWSKPYLDWLMLAMQTVIGCLMMYLICISNLCCTSWNWLIVPFNILPVICWCWRKWWALLYACVLLIWCGIMTGVAIWGNVLADWSHIVLVLSWTMVLLKQSPRMNNFLHTIAKYKLLTR